MLYMLCYIDLLGVCDEIFEQFLKSTDTYIPGDDCLVDKD